MKKPEYEGIVAKREAWQTEIDAIETELDQLREDMMMQGQRLSAADRDAAQAENDLARLQRDIDQLKSLLANREPQLRQLEASRVRLESQIPEESRQPESLQNVPLPDIVRLRINEMEIELAHYSGCADDSIMIRHGKQAENVMAQESFVNRRMNDVKTGEDELKACRASYIKLVQKVLEEYRDHAMSLAARAHIHLEMELPNLSNLDDSIEKAGLHVRVAYDGKDLRTLSDPDLSGGQKVIVSLLLLMALTDGEGATGPGFFILDEPFAHLSVERIDEVGEFLRNSRAQFILTTPTTHNHNVFNPAKLTITLFKKPHNEPLAPPPVICRV